MELTDLHLLSATEVARLIRDGIITSEQLVEACLARIREVDPQVQAWAFLDPNYALAQARAADQLRLSGAPIGPLHGVPVGIKDIFDMAVRDGIISIVAGEKDLQLVAQAGDGVKAVELVKKHLPDILLLDLRMPGRDGLEVIAQIQSLQLQTRVIVLTTFESEQDIHKALKAGARGYLLKDTPRPELLDAIRRVHAGEHHHEESGCCQFKVLCFCCHG